MLFEASIWLGMINFAYYMVISHIWLAGYRMVVQRCISISTATMKAIITVGFDTTSHIAIFQLLHISAYLPRTSDNSLLGANMSLDLFPTLMRLVAGDNELGVTFEG